MLISGNGSGKSMVRVSSANGVKQDRCSYNNKIVYSSFPACFKPILSADIKIHELGYPDRDCPSRKIYQLIIKSLKLPSG